MTDRHRNSLTEHHDKGWTLAEKIFADLWRGKIKDLKDYDDVRQAIDDLPENTQLQVTVADLWLNLSKIQSLNRRKQEPPAQPFTLIGKDLKGEKCRIRDWDLAWREIEHLRAGKAIYGSGGTAQAHAKAAEISKRIAVLTSQARDTQVIVGFVDMMASQSFAQALQHPERLRVSFVTWEEALVRPWWNKDDQLHVIDTYLRVLHEWRSEVNERVVLPTD